MFPNPHRRTVQTMKNNLRRMNSNPFCRFFFDLRVFCKNTKAMFVLPDAEEVVEPV
jgi:hypothetical protein